MSRYRKKPVVIEAVLHAGSEPWPDWFQCAVEDRTVRIFEDGEAEIETLEGVMLAKPGDWIIRGVKGELYPCKPDIFEATYEAAE
ncbi:MAG: hypothetical protein AB7I42_25060 [Bradyrhizobium sp.]|uniref:hypothetical protein n=1 Tax=Bradyrhizobium sp. TaxID=376 RepID=UPI003D1329B5